MSWCVLGATRGLGLHFTQLLLSNEKKPLVYASSRSEQRLKNLVGAHQTLKADVAQVDQRQELIQWAVQTNADVYICFIGGGPYGLFESTEWKDHFWSFQVSFLFQSEWLHSLLRKKDTGKAKKIVFIGSAIAEASADPKAASYCAAKHALLGLIQTVQQEHGDFDVRLYSPGYMDTAMLPANAAVRQTKLVLDPKVVALDLYEWIMDETKKSTHRVFPSSH